MIVALDGPAGSGKSSVAALVAERLGAEHVDTGSMYRAFALRCLQAGTDLSNEQEVAGLVHGTDLSVAGGLVLLGGEDVTGRLREPEVTAAASVIAQYPRVRRFLVELQRKVVKAAPRGAVVEGRDIGTVVLPDADVKIFLTASETTRARRRAAQAALSEEEARKEVVMRDRRDSAREHSPLKQAGDALVLDTTEMDLEQVVGRVLDVVEARRP